MSGNYSNIASTVSGVSSFNENSFPNSQRGTSNNENSELSRIYTSGKNNEYVNIGKEKFLRDDLLEAFGGSLNPGLRVPSEHKFANPAPLGLSAFALTTFLLSMYNVQARGVKIPNAIVGPAFFYGGLVQIIAGIWCIAVENTFGGTALCSFGGFWMSFATFFVPWFGILDAYKNDLDQLDNAIGIFLIGWALFTVFLCLCTMKSTLLFFSLFFFLSVTLFLLAVGKFTNSTALAKTGGVFGIVTAFISWYNAFEGLTDKHNSYLVLTSMKLPTNEYSYPCSRG
ncbi:hypothetical protein TPHA_0O01010 [Tetrapisispora phaffii CBS 4417]|uniref:Ammonia transport outward protein 2 n=1 Tax=Tetrapisispora phaffii (strain ATCC 24235 / CBS 4417 / NBRC 1672 / NRRL Y-8282 / UCD 70-5) TaxID=1071381 RepID=G8C1P2_TETPH|nr:hypothetical protein TPHA_0O01010 [Tetrapisispora phaffii CBS 4417]CCE66070.1 hypothetical protein TPHA_0O01010 [Tetrapisispora phaffii CBS 4417]